MSTITVHRIEDIARRHVARIAQIEAMPPQLARANFNAWDFNRPPYPHAITRLRGRQTEALGLTVDEAPSGGDFEPAVSAFLRAETITFRLVAPFTGVALTYFVYGQHRVSYPYRIVGAHATIIGAAAAANSDNFNIFIRDETIDIVTPTLDGVKVFETYVRNAAAFGIGTQIGPQLDVAVPDGLNRARPDNLFYESGGGPYRAGTVPCIAIPNELYAGSRFVYVTIKIAETGVDATRFFQPLPRRPGPDPGPSPGPGAPPPDWTEVF